MSDQGSYELKDCLHSLTVTIRFLEGLLHNEALSLMDRFVAAKELRSALATYVQVLQVVDIEQGQRQLERSIARWRRELDL